MFSMGRLGSFFFSSATNSKEDVSHPLLSSQEQSSTPLTIYPANALSAEFAHFIFRVLIERSFFQNTAIPQELCLHLASDLINNLRCQKANTISVAKEVAILWKEVKGVPLSPSNCLAVQYFCLFNIY